MIVVPEFLLHPEWYEEDEAYANVIGHNDKRYKIKENAPDYIKKSYEEYLKWLSEKETEAFEEGLEINY